MQELHLDGLVRASNNNNLNESDLKTCLSTMKGQGL